MKQFSSGISSFTSGTQRTTWKTPALWVRLSGFALALAALAFLIVRIDTDIWRAQGHLEEGFAAIKTEKFYLGINLRANFRKLHASLLDFYRTGNPTDQENFRREALGLASWLADSKTNFLSRTEQAAFLNIEAAYQEFLAKVDPLVRTNSSVPVRPDAFAAVYSQVRIDSRPLLKACDDLVEAEHAGFDAFLLKSDNALVSLQRLFMGSLLLLIALAAALALLVYRGMIAPLRAQLSESQALIARQEKLASLGVLGAGVAHEIRNPLTAIKFRLFSLKKALPPELADNEDVHTISDEINRLDRIVKDFLQFARPSDPELVRFPAERILQEVHDLMKSELEHAGIDFRLEVSQPTWLFADTYQLKQVLINLVQNSADSIGKNGTIKLGLKQALPVVPGNGRHDAVISVTDTGKGIPPDVQKRLFDPFFTTKEGGTGLGLAIAARIVEKHGGLLRYRTEINRGTIFEILLPATETYATQNTADRG